MPPEERRHLFEDEDRLEALRAQAEAARLDAIEAASGESAAAREGLATIWMEEWREAIAAGDEGRAALYSERVRRLDPAGRFDEEIDGLGRVRIAIEPVEASVTLFRHDEEAGLFPTPEAGELPPGSYLAVARLEGYEELRVPFEVPRRRRVEVAARMNPAATSPPGFVFVSGGPYRAGGDPQALNSWAGEIREVSSFWIAKHEVTVGEYLEFLNDPATLAEIEDHETKTGERIRVPRDFAEPLGHWKREGDGLFHPKVDPATPVAAVTWGDAKAFCRWRSERGAPWVFDLPREVEWEKAARGVDGRAYPWGDRFDWGDCAGALSQPERGRLPPVGSFPRDESPYGVRDMAGSVSEWCEDWRTEGVTRVLRGGSFELSSPAFFRAAYRSGSYPEILLVQPGFRLVARRQGERDR